MNKKLLVATLGILIIASLVIVIKLQNSGAVNTHEVVRDTIGYQPAELTINRGDTVRFINRGGAHHWPASDLHPTHGVYPDFDPRRAIADGEVWEFTFAKRGEWKFHDHVRANIRGVINVK